MTIVPDNGSADVPDLLPSQVKRGLRLKWFMSPELQERVACVGVVLSLFWADYNASTHVLELLDKFIAAIFEAGPIALLGLGILTLLHAKHRRSEARNTIRIKRRVEPHS